MINENAGVNIMVTERSNNFGKSTNRVIELFIFYGEIVRKDMLDGKEMLLISDHVK